MSLQPTVEYRIPEQTLRVAKAAFPKGTLCLQIYDHLGTVFKDQDFADLFPRRGQPASAPFRLALVTILQYVENLSDRQAAEAVRSRLDWKYLLCLELEESGFDHSVLCEFRARLLEGSLEMRLLEKLLELLKEQRLVKAGSTVRTDSTHVLALVREMNRLERVIETLRATLNALATVIPDWVRETISQDWIERYGPRAEAYRLPKKPNARIVYAEQVGADGNVLLDALWSPSTPAWVREIPAVEVLRQVWIHNFVPVESSLARWRELKKLPPRKLTISSPYETEARYRTKRTTTWLGYKVHLSESCEASLPKLITQVYTSSSLHSDNDALPPIHAHLETMGLLPGKHLVDSAYTEAANLVNSHRRYGVDLIGPVLNNYNRQGREEQGFSLSDFSVNWETQRVSCPHGKLSSVLKLGPNARGDQTLRAHFSLLDCKTCDDRSRCTSSASGQRNVKFLPRALHEALEQARDRQKTDSFKQQYRQRAGVEGTISQAVRAFGLRQARYRGLAKTRLQHIATAVAMNLVRLGAWFSDQPLFRARKSAFIKAMESLPA